MLDFLTWIKDWFTSGIYEFFTNAFASLIEWLILGFLDYAIWAVQFSWDIAKVVLADLHISEHLNTAFSALPPEVAEKVRYFRLPEAIVNILSGLVGKIVFRFLPGI